MAAMYGLKVRTREGVVTLEPETPISRLVGSFSTGVVGGSFVVPSEHTGNIFYFATQAYVGDYRGPTVSKSGRTITWDWWGDTPSRQPATIWYGVFA